LKLIFHFDDVLQCNLINIHSNFNAENECNLDCLNIPEMIQNEKLNIESIFSEQSFNYDRSMRAHSPKHKPTVSQCQDFFKSPKKITEKALSLIDKIEKYINISRLIPRTSFKENSKIIKHYLIEINKFVNNNVNKKNELIKLLRLEHSLIVNYINLTKLQKVKSK